MAKILSLGAVVDNTAVAAQTAVSTVTTPHARGHTAIAEILFTGMTGSPVVKIQTSPDNSTWTDVLTTSGITRTVFSANVTLDKYARLNVTTGGSAGKVDANLIA